MAPGDAWDLDAMVRFALGHDHPTAIRYPKATAETVEVERDRKPIRPGMAEVISTGDDGAIVACGAVLSDCLRAAQALRDEGLDVGVVNARFVKPIDTETLVEAIRRSPFVVTVEEGALMGGFGSAVLEAANAAGLDTGTIRRLGVPDRFVEHGSRAELLADLGLDPAGITAACREMAKTHNSVAQAVPDGESA
jgi:1-deoxy-D-xylulose-5-phosphate synthase